MDPAWEATAGWVLDAWLACCVLGLLVFLARLTAAPPARERKIDTTEALPVDARGHADRDEPNDDSNSNDGGGAAAPAPAATPKPKDSRKEKNLAAYWGARVVVAETSSPSLSRLLVLPKDASTSSLASLASSSGAGIRRKHSNNSSSSSLLNGVRHSVSFAEDSVHSKAGGGGGGRKLPVPVAPGSAAAMSLSWSRTGHAPHPPSSPLRSSSIALEFDECPVCFTHLYLEPIAVCATTEGVATCKHYYHDRCLRVVRQRTCLVCQAPFTRRRVLPNIEDDPHEWFNVVDLDHSGGLDAAEVARALAAQLPLERKCLKELLDRKWLLWDKNGNGNIDLAEFLRPKTGLLDYLKRKRDQLKRVEPVTEVPDVRDDSRLWFDYWDYDKTNSLDQSEVTRALIISFGLSKDATICIGLARTLREIWPVFDPNGDGTITKNEFLHPKDGLAASITSSLEVLSTPRSVRSSPAMIPRRTSSSSSGASVPAVSLVASPHHSLLLSSGSKAAAGVAAAAQSPSPSPSSSSSSPANNDVSIHRAGTAVGVVVASSPPRMPRSMRDVRERNNIAT